MKSVPKKKVTLMLDERVYTGLRARVGARGIGDFLSELARPHVALLDLEKGYAQLAKDSVHKHEAREWLTGTKEVLTDENVWQF